MRTYPPMHTYLASRVHPAAGYVVGGAVWHIHQDRDAREGDIWKYMVAGSVGVGRLGVVVVGC